MNTTLTAMLTEHSGVSKTTAQSTCIFAKHASIKAGTAQGQRAGTELQLRELDIPEETTAGPHSGITDTYKSLHGHEGRARTHDSLLTVLTARTTGLASRVIAHADCIKKN